MTATDTDRQTYFEQMPIGRIHPDPINPRTHFDIDDDFIASIRPGLIQPIVVRPDRNLPTLDGEPGSFSIIAGHRRYLAAQACEHPTVRVIVRYDLEDDDATVLEQMIVENSQRKSLTALEEAEAYQQLIALGRTQRSIENVVGRAQGTISKRLQLLKLPERAKALLEHDKISTATAIQMGALVKHNDRLARVLDFATRDGIDDHDVRNKIDIELTKIKNDASHTKRVKALVARGLEVLDTKDTKFDRVAWRVSSEDDATAFDDVGNNFIQFYRPRVDPAAADTTSDDSPDDDEEERSYQVEQERLAAAKEVRDDLVTNLLGDGYPGDDQAFQYVARMRVEQVIDDTDAEIVLNLLGIEITDDDEDDTSDEDPANVALLAVDPIRAAFASALLNGEQACRYMHNWAAAERRHYLRLLQDNGYELQTAEERALFGDTTPNVDPVEEVDLTGAVNTPDVTDLVTNLENSLERAHEARDAHDTNAEVNAAPAGTDDNRPSEPVNGGLLTEGAATSAPWKGYDDHTPGLIRNTIRSKSMTAERLRQVVEYERDHAARADVISFTLARLEELDNA